MPKPASFFLIPALLASSPALAQNVVPATGPAAAAAAAAYALPAPAGVTMPDNFLPAFPGAEGFGANTPGGRGGQLYEVTTLNDSGPGSLRDAVSHPNRTIIFRTSGTIELQSKLLARQPFITIAGQTAPGDGICLRGYTFQIQTHDVVVRFLRSRLGDLTGQQDDSISILNGCHDVIVDHCSATWSVHEGLSTSGNDQNITVQWCLIANALNASIHDKGQHGYGSLARANGPISWYHNLWAHNIARNPRLGDAYNRGSHPFFDVRYNVIYDPGEVCSGLTQGIFNVNYVNNYIKFGPDTRAKFPFTVGPPSLINFYLAGNTWEGNPASTADNSKFLNPADFKDTQKLATVDKPFPCPITTPYTAQEAFDAALANVGAVLPKRDSVDTAILDTVRTGTGKPINSQNDVGGWPELKSTEPPLDSDHDGIPDAWELAHHLNPNDPSDANADPDKDGYTNLEEFLNNTDPNQFTDYKNPKNNHDSMTTTPPKP